MQKKKVKKYQFGDNPCGTGTVWDDVKKKCVPVIEKNITQQDLLWGNLVNNIPNISENLYPVYDSGEVSPSALKSAGTDTKGNVIKSDVVYPEGVGVKDSRGRFIPQNMVVGDALDKGFNLDYDNVYRKKEITEDKNKLWYNPTFQALNAAMDITRLIANPITDAKNSKEEREKLLRARYMRGKYNFDENGLNNVPVYMQNGGAGAIYTSNKNDPRLKAYNDSLKTFNLANLEQKNYYNGKSGVPVPFSKNPQFNSANEFIDSHYGEYTGNSYNRAKELNTVAKRARIKPYGQYTPPPNTGGIGDQYPAYFKKPVQPVIYKPEEPTLKKGKISQQKLLHPERSTPNGIIFNDIQVPSLGEIKKLPYVVDFHDEEGQPTQQRFANKAEADAFYNELNKRRVNWASSSQGNVSQYVERQMGGNVNNTGYTPGTPSFNNPYNVIPSGNITMKNTPFPIMAYPNVGSPKMLYPGGKYNFPKATSVLEIPSMQIGGDAYSGYSEQPAPQEQSIAKIPDQAPVHEDGGVNVNNVAELEQGEVYTEDASGNPVRVLEDTSDKREDVKSKTLKVTPEEAKELVNFKPKRSVTHSRLFEEASKYYDKKYKGVEKKIEKNLEYIRLRNGGKYSENSFEENLKMLQQIPTSQQIFDVIYAHQQEAKRKYNVENKDKMKYGGLPKYQNGTKYIDPDGNVIQVGDKIYGVSDVEGDDPILTQYAVESYLRNGIIRPFNNIGNKGKYVDKLNPSVYSLEDKLQLFSSQDTTTGYQPFVPGTDRAGTVSGYNPEHSTWNSYYFNKPITASDFQKNVQVALKPILGYDYDFNSGDKTVDNVYGNVTFNTPLPKAKVVGKKPGVISLQEYIDTTDKSELADKYGITVEQLDNAFSKNNKQYNNQLIITTDDIQPHESSKSQRENIPTIDKKNTSLVPGINDKYSKPEEVIPSTVSSHLGLSGGLGNILGYIDTGRIPVDLEQIDFRPIRARELNPLPTLLENYNDYNAASNMLPHSGAGYANQANLQAQRYRLNNQVMGQYENMNKQRLDAVDAANTQAQMSVDQANMAIRDTFNTRVLTSKEKQRQQKAEYLNGLFKAIDERNAFDRNANLALKLSPFFNEKGEFNHNKYTLSIPTNMAGSENSVQYITDKQTGQKFRIIMDSNGKLISSSKVIGDNKAAEKTPSIK